MPRLKIKLNIKEILIPSNSFKLFGALFLLLIITSCAKAPIPPDVSAIDVGTYIDRIMQEQKEIKSVRSLAIVRLNSPERKVSYRQATLVKSPNLMRLEAYSVFGRTEALIISDGERVGLKYSNRNWEYSEINKFDISRFYSLVPLHISIEQLSSFLLGKIPEEKLAGEYMLDTYNEDGLLVFKSVRGDDELFVNHAFRKIVKANIDMKNGDKVKIKFDDFINIYPHGYFPTKLELEFMNYSIYVKYDDDLDVNKEIHEDNYSLMN